MSPPDHRRSARSDAGRGGPATRVSPLTRGLLLLALASSLLLSLALAGLGEPTTLRELRHFATATQGVDSWRPMSQAHAYLTLSPDALQTQRPLYDWLFFERRVKFIYPPTALLPLDLLPHDGRVGLRALLNALSWLLVLATAGFAAAAFDRALQATRFASAGADRALRAGVAVVLALTFYPVLKAYSLGQMQVWVNACFAAAVWCWLAGHRASAGVLVVLMAAVKPQIGLVALWGVARREWRFVAAVALAGALVLGVSLLRFGWEHHVDYLRVVSHVSRLGEAYWPNQTPNGLLNRLLGNGISDHWDPRVYPPYHAAVHALTLATSAALIVAGLWPVSGAGRTGAAPDSRLIAGRGGALDLGAMALGATIASPIAWEHHYGVLLPLFALLLPALLQRGSRGAIALLALGYAVAANHFDALGRIPPGAWSPLQSLLLVTALGVLAALLALRSGRSAAVRAA